MNLEIPIENFTRISSAYQARLKNLGILTMRDLIYHFPFRYQDFSARADIADYMGWYNAARAHSRLGDLTPDEHYFAHLPALAMAA